MRVRHLHVALGLLASGCYLFHGTPEEDGGRVDAGRVDAGSRADAGSCPTLGGYRRCGEACPVECPRDEGQFCHEWTGVCREFPPNAIEEPRGHDGCSLGMDGDVVGDVPHARYCWSGGICAIRAVTLDDPSYLNGLCLGEAYCREVPFTELGNRCVYSDGTPYVDGPPEVESCPPATDERTPFCGGPCGACPYWDPGPFYNAEWKVSCVGISEARGLGVCTMSPYACRPGGGLAVACENPTLHWSAPCACLLLRQPDGSFNDWGFTTFESSCRAYRDLYPGEVECMEPAEWAPLE
jgi:hypothetical protein